VVRWSRGPSHRAAQATANVPHPPARRSTPSTDDSATSGRLPNPSPIAFVRLVRRLSRKADLCRRERGNMRNTDNAADDALERSCPHAGRLPGLAGETTLPRRSVMQRARARPGDAQSPAKPRKSRRRASDDPGPRTTASRGGQKRGPRRCFLCPLMIVSHHGPREPRDVPVSPSGVCGLGRASAATTPASPSRRCL
jgi:hypothetical protein